MTIISSIPGTVGDLAGRITKGEDPVFVTSEERASAHGVLTSRGGRRIRISLPRGTELNDGDVLSIEDGTAVVVRAAEEALFRITPQSGLMWGVAAFHLGNLHRPVRFLDTAMLTPADVRVAEVLKDAGVGFEAIEAPFVGMRFGSYSGHDHDHDHAHDHGDAPAHDHPHSHEGHGSAGAHRTGKQGK